MTEELLSFAAGLNLEGISADVLRGAKLSILDGLGTALLASGHEKSRQIAGALIEISPGDINLWGYSSKASPLAACTINGTLVEGLGYSDIHVDAGLHPTGAVLPAVLTFGEAHRKGGEETLVSFILGCEVMIRVGLSAPRRFHRRGFQPTSVIGVLGAALAVSKIMGLHRPQMDNALSLATTVAFGSPLSVRVGAYFGGPDPGRAAEAGLFSATLARNGVEGIATTNSMEGKFGFLETYAGRGNYDRERITDRLGELWEMRDLFRKRYPTSYACTNVLDAAIRLSGRVKSNISTVREVRFGESSFNIGLFTKPNSEKRRPRSMYDAETSYYFLLAVALTHGRVTAQMLERIDDAALMRIIDRTRPVVDEDSRWVEVEFKDGRVIREVQDELVPTSEKEIHRKFFENAESIVGKENASHIENIVDSMEQLKDVRTLTHLLRGRKVP